MLDPFRETACVGLGLVVVDRPVVRPSLSRAFFNSSATSALARMSTPCPGWTSKTMAVGVSMTGTRCRKGCISRLARLTDQSRQVVDQDVADLAPTPAERHGESAHHWGVNLAASLS